MNELLQLLRDTQLTLLIEEESGFAGVDQIPDAWRRADLAVEPALRPAAGSPARQSRSGSASTTSATTTRTGADTAPIARGEESLEAIEAELTDCQRCKLSQERQHLVFGVGNRRAALMFIGEAPGADEDREGVPFVGKAGQLLTRIINAMGLQRDDVYICNIVKCRPPQNRDPLPDEIGRCEPFLRRQIAAVQPRVIVALGKFAAQTLLASEEPISRLRGRFTQYHDTPLMPTFHPAYLLRNPEKKREVWNDMQAVMSRFELTPQRSAK